MIEHRPKMEIYTKTKIKREYGWTDKCMQYLPEPNKTWYGRYKSQKFPAWTKDLVDQTNARPEVQKILRWKKRHAKNWAKGAAQATQTKINKTIEKISQIKVQVMTGYSKKELTRLCYENHFDFLASRGIFDDDGFVVDDRKIVNYIRHNLTSYECDLDELYHQVGQAIGYGIISQKVFATIKKAYPQYANECDRQLEEHLARNGLTLEEVEKVE